MTTRINVVTAIRAPVIKVLMKIAVVKVVRATAAFSATRADNF